MPTFRKFLKRFAPKLMGTSPSTGPSKSSALDISQSKLHRQQRTGYSQFDFVEMDNFSDSKDARMQSSVMGLGGSLTKESRGIRETNRDDTSEEAMLDEAVAYTGKYHGGYSK